MASGLTPDQKARIEQNRKLALERRAARINQSSSHTIEATANKNSNASFKSNSNFQKIALERSSCTTTTSSLITQNVSNCQVSSTSCVVPPNKSNLQTIQSPVKTLPFYQSHSHSSKNVSSNFSPLDLKYVKSTNPGEYQKKQTSINPLPSKSSSYVADTRLKLPNSVHGVCQLISKLRFTVNIPYHQQVIDIFRTINGKEYDSKSRLWTFPLTEYSNFKKAVSVLRPHVIIEDLPRCIVETFITKAKIYQQDISKVDISRIDEKLRQTIYPFQKEGIQYGVSKGGRCLIADDMGLGKSIQALGIADYYREDWPLLIVCPSSMRFQWEEEIRINLPNSVHTHQVFVMTSGKDLVDGAQVLILSYDLLVKKRDLIKAIGFGVTIMDECHSIKSIKTQRGKTALEVAQQCKRVILLSGTPILSRPAELFTQIQAIDPSAFKYFKEYGLRYCGGTLTKMGLKEFWDFSGSSNMEELKLLLEARFMIRRLKSNVLTQLPSKIRQVIALNSQSLNKSNESMNAFALKLQSSSLKGRERHGTLLSYFAETAKTKSTAVCEYIKDMLQENRKFLCFAHHAEMLDAVSNTLEDNKTYYIRIDGTVSAEDRKTLCDKFQYEDKWQVAVLSIKAANTGLTLTAAQVVIFAELFWNPGDLAQAEDRAHRIGQEDCVVVKYLIAKGTADDYLWPLIQSKLDVLNKAGLSKDSFVTAETKCIQGPERKTKSQTKIDDYFENPFCDEDDDDLLKVMDEVEGVQEKKIRLDC